VIVVSDTSPILNLSIVGWLEILRSLFGEIVLPPWVAAELSRHRIICGRAFGGCRREALSAGFSGPAKAGHSFREQIFVSVRR